MIDEKKLINKLIIRREKLRYISVATLHNNMSYVDTIINEINSIIDIINEQPKVGDWIPCSERLPETDDVVLITVFNIDNNKLFVTPAVYQHPFFCTWNTLAPEDKVIAWQPLPEPWEGEE